MCFDWVTVWLASNVFIQLKCEKCALCTNGALPVCLPKRPTKWRVSFVAPRVRMSNISHFYYASLLSDLMGDKCFFSIPFFSGRLGQRRCLFYSLFAFPFAKPGSDMIWEAVFLNFIVHGMGQKEQKTIKRKDSRQLTAGEVREKILIMEWKFMRVRLKRTSTRLPPWQQGMVKMALWMRDDEPRGGLWEDPPDWA